MNMARTMTPAETLRAYCAAFARHEGDAIEALFAQDAILDLPLYDRRLNGRDEIIHELRTALRGIKNITVVLDHVVENGDRAFAEGIFAGEHVGIPPHVDGTPRICELVQYELQDVAVKGAWSGPAAIELFQHALAPVAALPVLEVVSGVHILADLTLGLGRVVHDYLKN